MLNKNNINNTGLPSYENLKFFINMKHVLCKLCKFTQSNSAKLNVNTLIKSNQILKSNMKFFKQIISRFYSNKFTSWDSNESTFDDYTWRYVPPEEAKEDNDCIWEDTSFKKTDHTWEETRSSSSEIKNSENISPTAEIKNDDSRIYEFILSLFLLLFLPFYIRLFIFSILLIDFRKKYIFYKLGQGDFETYMDPFEILFSQANINTCFKNGGLIEDLINDLVDESIRVNDIEIVKVCIIDNNYFSFDNRRLYCFQEAIKRGAKFKKIPVIFTRENDNIRWKISGSKQIVHNSNWFNVRVSNQASNNVVISDDGIWRKC